MQNQCHLFGGESGGVGKTTVCSAAIAYLQSKDHSFTLFDTDPTKPDIWKAHKHLGCRLARFSESDRLQDAANSIVNATLDSTVLVNLPASSFIALSQWFAANDLSALTEEFSITFILWFVLDGSDSGLQLLRRSLTHFNGTVHHIAVKNHGTNKTNCWEAFQHDGELQDLLTAYSVPVIDFPNFHGDAQRTIIANQNLSLQEAVSYEGFDAIPRQRIKRFLRESAAAFESAHIFS
ncbi:MAG: hypothetical protein AAF329_00015 [Cyanobacteria bacterium P01_A01_bin.17]